MLEKLPLETLEAMFDALPVEISFVDSEDTVVYYNKGDDRIFKRSPSIIGRKVQDCHSRKSVPLVDQILEDFRAGRRDVAEFWNNLDGRKIYIRYFPVRDRAGNYLGCLAVTQDITAIQQIVGEKRHLD